MLKNLTEKNWVCLLWILIAVICWIHPYLYHQGNNYKIFVGVYQHLINLKNLYIEYPGEYGDTNHYGPLFGIVIAPFAILPDILGGLLWNIFNAIALLFAVYKLPLDLQKKNNILLFSAISFAQSQHEIQSNALIAALIILSFVYTIEKKEGLATLLIISGALIKLYPIIGIAFFLFSSNKKRFFFGLVIWSALLISLPALMSSVDFVLQSYVDWFHSLRNKNELNVALTSTQDYSIMGLFRHIFQNSEISNIPFLVFGATIFGISLLQFRQYSKRKDNIDLVRYKLNLLCSALLIVVLFSTGTESQTYIIAVIGCFTWLQMQEEPFKSFNLVLVLFLIIFTGMAPTDIFPYDLRDTLVTRWTIMAWPCIIIWLKLSSDSILNPFSFEDNSNQKRLIHDDARAIR
jgi:hypothetical protein